jgi:ankyrin repeat protein
MHEALVAADQSVSAVARLIAEGEDVDARDPAGRTPLFYAAGRSNTELCQYLLDHGAEPNSADEDGETVLMWAAEQKGNREVVKMLIEAGADVNARSLDDGTALMWAVSYGSSDVARVLLAAGADVAPAWLLAQAWRDGNREVAGMLLERGALVAA